MKHREISRFARIALLATVGRSVWLLPVVVLGAVGVEIIASLVYDAAIAGQPLTWIRVGRTVIVLIVLVICAYGFFLLDRRRARRWTVGSDVRMETIAPHAGLIWLLSPDRVEPLLIALRHHTAPEISSGDRLRHCWVLVTEHPTVQQTYDGLADELDRHGMGDVTLHRVPLSSPDVEQTYETINHVYESELPSCGLAPSEVVTDFTGGFKTMSVGAMLACLFQERPLEYLQSTRDRAGEPIAGSERPVRVNVAFFVEREERA